MTLRPINSWHVFARGRCPVALDGQFHENLYERIEAKVLQIAGKQPALPAFQKHESAEPVVL